MRAREGPSLKRSPLPRAPFRRDRREGGNSGGRGGFSERSPSPPRPLSPEERLALEGDASAGLVPPVSGGAISCGGMSPRRLTEPPRTCGVGICACGRGVIDFVFGRPSPQRRRTLAGRGGSVSRRDLNQPARNRALLAGANCLIESSTRTPAAFRVGARGRGLSLKGRLPRNLSRSLFSAGRGGSVSRRDLNQPARNRALLAGANCLIESSTRTPAAFRVGARGRGLSLKGRLPRIPLTSPSVPLSLRCS